jgi:uncharacterized protein (UPF0335 family)
MGIQGDKKGAPMTSKEHEARCRALRGGMTESEAAIIADLSVVEQDREDLRNSLQDAYDEMRGHGWYIETAMAEALAASNIDRNVIADMTIYLPGPHAVNADCAGKRRAKRPFR